MMIPQVAAQQRGGPSGRVIAKFPWVAVDHSSDQFVESATGCPGAAWASRVEKACPQIEVGTILESTYPVVDGLTSEEEQLGDLRDINPLVQPEQRPEPDIAP